VDAVPAVNAVTTVPAVPAVPAVTTATGSHGGQKSGCGAAASVRGEKGRSNSRKKGGVGEEKSLSDGGFFFNFSFVIIIG
jgi:hypothetical protein